MVLNMKTAILVELKRTLQALGMPADVRVSLFPDLAAVGDELVLEWEDARQLALAHIELSREQTDAMGLLDEYVEALSGKHMDFWLDRESLFQDARWQDIRVLAKKTLYAFRWPAEESVSSGAMYTK